MLRFTTGSSGELPAASNKARGAEANAGTAPANHPGDAAANPEHAADTKPRSTDVEDNTFAVTDWEAITGGQVRG